VLKGFRELRVWQAGMEVVEDVYRLTKQFPQHERYALANQMQRAAVSVPSNIAEGYTRDHRREYLQFLSVAQSSLAELDTQLEIAGRLGYGKEDTLHELQEKVTGLQRQLRTLRNRLKSKE